MFRRSSGYKTDMAAISILSNLNLPRELEAEGLRRFYGWSSRMVDGSWWRDLDDALLCECADDHVGACA